MQYVGKVGGYVYNQWNSLNPATLLGAIDIIVVEQPDGSLHCSPWHVRFGKFQIIKPLHKKVDLYVNDIKTSLPMKLGEGGEAFFVFETANGGDLSKSVLTSPVISPANSPPGSPPPELTSSKSNDYEPELLDLANLNVEGELQDAAKSADQLLDQIEDKIKLSESAPELTVSPTSTAVSSVPSRAFSRSPTPSIQLKLAFEKARKITQKLNIPSKIDVNGDMVLDMDGYKPNAQKNIDNTDEVFKKIFMKEVKNLSESEINDENSGYLLDSLDKDYDQLYKFWDQIICKDKNGNIRILNKDNTPNEELTALQNDLENSDGLSINSEKVSEISGSTLNSQEADDKTYIKTLRLTSEQLQKMNLHYGCNKLKFKLSQGNSQIISNLFLWKSTTPIVISDIDGTITKSDALGHVLNLFGKDWTHPGVANLFQDISYNGYNIIYLTARSVGQADSTRQYLESINQDGMKLPKGPVILSPDRTMAALRREVILKKPEVFKMACLSDIRSLYLRSNATKKSNVVMYHERNNSDVSLGSHDTNDLMSNDDERSKEDYAKHLEQVENSTAADDDRTPFYAGFGNRITDAISYRSVKVPLHRIFTINPNGEVHMELLELAGYKSSYVHIGELVDHFFPPLRQVNDFNFSNLNDNQFNQYIMNRDIHDANSPGYSSGNDPYSSPPRSPGPGSPRSFEEEDTMLNLHTDEKFSDVNYWREPLTNLSDLSDLEEEEEGSPRPSLMFSSPLRRATSNDIPLSPTRLLLGSQKLTDSNISVTLHEARRTLPKLTHELGERAQKQEKKQQREQYKKGEKETAESEGNQSPERPSSMAAFTSPLKNFMLGSGGKRADSVDDTAEDVVDDSMMTNDSDYTGEDDYTGDEDDDEDDDDYTDDDYEEDEDEDDNDDDDYEDDYEEDLDDDLDVDGEVPEDGEGADNEVLAHDVDAGDKIIKGPDPTIVSASSLLLEATSKLSIDD